jgi:hypothetical protein
MNDYHHKYLKYKTKYLSLQKQTGGACSELRDRKYKTRPSPSYHANLCKGEVKDGNDGDKYISAPDKNGIYRWKKINETIIPKKRYEPNYDIKPILEKLNKISKQLIKSDIFLLEIEQCYRCRFDDDTKMIVATTTIAEKKNIVTEAGIEAIPDTFSFLFYTDDFYHATNDGVLQIQHNILPKDKQIIINVFEEYFEGVFDWDGAMKKTIDIKLPKL